LLPRNELHKHDIFADSLGDLAGRVDALRVDVDDDFSENFGMITMAAIARVRGAENRIAEPIDSVVYDTNEVAFGDVCLQIHWQEKLIHGILNKETVSFQMVGRTSILPRNGFFLFYNLENEAVSSHFFDL